MTEGVRVGRGDLLHRGQRRVPRGVQEGGYGRKQIHELVHAADAMRRAPGTIEVRLTDDVLYVANEGEPFSEAGVVALLYSHLSRKADDQIGRFGLGFKSVTAISSSPQIFSRSGSFGFDKARSEAVIRSKVPAAPMIPALRVAWALSPSEWRARRDPCRPHAVGNDSGPHPAGARAEPPS
ncbi:sacsin N-terminal ATP-binding-like domain-containing protein [Georgenia sp. SUBG003]|uniref:sacsin N-terminal ATP-binding-like domain-containing protein n=1 Tax=Georgenia sp. SUBG003 TaxID=1497974 RepID=UPI003AB884F8